MARDQTIQALDRGLLILRLLADQGRMTASGIAEEMGVHQSTASRLLNSLHKAGLVKKPDFHSFSLDYGAVVFAGQAMQCFPSVTASVQVCNHISEGTGLNAAVAILRDNRLLYLTQCDQNRSSALRLINDSSFPVHHSSLGRAIAWSMGKRQGKALLRRCIGDSNDDSSQADAVYADVEASMDMRGFLLLREYCGNVLNAAMPFDLEGQPAAIAVFSRDQVIPESELADLLRTGVEEISKFMARMK